jgi:hypothetical protein
MVVQIPVFFVVQVIFVTIRRGAVLWLDHDPSQVDPTNVFNLFATPPTVISPFLHLGRVALSWA